MSAAETVTRPNLQYSASSTSSRQNETSIVRATPPQVLADERSTKTLSRKQPLPSLLMAISLYLIWSVKARS